MALDRQITRIAKILGEGENISFDEAQAKLRSLTLEIVVGPDATSPAAHAAILTAVSVASRTFVGGVQVTGAVDQRLNSVLPLSATSLAEAVILTGASEFDSCPSRTICVGTNKVPTEVWSVSPWWKGWRAGTTKPGKAHWDAGDNPLPGIAAGALAVGAAFKAERGYRGEFLSEVDLWPVGAGEVAPRFVEVFLPGALWLVGLGNLGQAFLWALATLPYANPGDVSLVVQDRDKVTEENCGYFGAGQGRGLWDTKDNSRRVLGGQKRASTSGESIVVFSRATGIDNDDPRLALSGR